MPAEFLQNYWFWGFVLFAPAIICIGSFHSSGVSLALRSMVAALLGWPILLMAVNRAWDLRIEFLPSDATPAQMQAATADGANKIFTLFWGWIPSTLWAVLILIAWVIIREVFGTYGRYGREKST